MSWLFKVFFFLSFCFPLCALGEGNFLQKCYAHFTAGSAKFSFAKEEGWKNPYAQELFSFVYRELRELEKMGWSLKEIKVFSSSLEGLLMDIEKSSSHTALQQRLKLMAEPLSLAVQAVPAIFAFINSGKAESYPALDVKTILKLILSTLSYHTRAYLNHPHSHKLDWGRMALILKSISDFRTKPNVFSLYKIQIAVRAKYSLEEYINCH